MRHMRVILCLASLIVAGSSARAAITYEYVSSLASGGPIQGTTASYSVAQGGSVAVNVYLQETVTGASTSLIASDGGLGGAGFSMNKVGGAGGAGDVTMTAIAGQTGNGQNFAGGLPFIQPTFPATSFGSTESVSVSATNGPGANFTGTNTSFDILLATVTFTSTSALTPTQYTLANRNASNGNTETFGSGNGPYGLDKDSSNPAYSGAADLPSTITINVAGVPEPSSMILTGLVASTVGLGVWMRRRREVVSTETANV